MTTTDIYNMSEDKVLNEKTDNVQSMNSNNVNEIDNLGNQFFLELFDLVTINSADTIGTKTEIIDLKVLGKLLVSKKILEDERDILKKINKKCKGNELSVTYTLGHKNKEDRYYAKKSISLQSLSRNVRALLAILNYWDLDAVNSHSNLIFNFCRKHGISSPCIDEYVNNRYKITSKVMREYGLTESEAKREIISVINGQGVDGYLKPLRDEMIKIRNYAKGIYPEHFKKRNKADDENDVSKFCSLLFKFERVLMMECHNYLQERNFSVDVLIHDGFLVRKTDKYVLEEYIDKCVEHVRTKFGISKFDLKIKPLVSDFSVDDEVDEDDTLIDDRYACEVFAELTKGYIKYDDDYKIIYVFDETCGIWRDGERNLNKLVTKHRDELVFNKNERVYDYSGIQSKQKNMLTYIDQYAEICNNFIDENIDSSKHKLLFNDGIFNMETGTFTHGFNKDIVFIDKINRNFDVERDEGLIDEVNNIFFKQPFIDGEQNVGVNFRIFLSFGIAGDCIEKIVGMRVGSNDAGKGLLDNMLKFTFGNFIGNFNSSSLREETIDNDDARKHNWLRGIAHKRLVISSEVKRDDNKKLSANKIKSIFSGSMDIFKIRPLYTDKEIDIRVRSTPLISCNDIPKFDLVDDALIKRLGIFDQKVKFCEKPNTALNEKQVDKGLLVKLSCDKYYTAFFWLMMDSYKLYRDNKFDREMFKVTKDLWFNDEGISIKEIIEEEYIITKDDKDIISSKELNSLIKSKIEMSDRVIARELEKLGVKTAPNSVWCDGKSQRVKTGIKRRDVE